MSNFTYAPSPPYFLGIVFPSSLLLRNPATTAPITLSVSSYDSDSTGNLIDSAVPFTSPIIFTPAQTTSFSITSRTSYTNLASASYSFNIKLSADLLASEYVTGSVANVTVPSQVVVSPGSKCYSTAASLVDLSCLVSSQNIIIPLDTIFVYLSNSPSGMNTF